MAFWLLVSPATAETAPSTPATAAASESAPRARPVVVADNEVFTLQAPAANKSAEERARQATKALVELAARTELPELSVVREGEAAVLYAGQLAIVRLTPEDARLAGKDSLERHAGDVMEQVQQALVAEHRRSRVATNVFSVSLVVFFGLVAFYLMRKVADLCAKLRAWIEKNGEKLTVRVRDVEVVRSEMVQSASLVGLGLVRWLGQGAVLYVWIVASLSLFGLTRHADELTQLVLTPLSQLTTRVATTVPVFIVALMAGVALFVLLRFVSLLFSGVAKHETTLVWVPPDLALPTSILLRAGIVVVALVFAAPIVTGDAQGAFPRLGFVSIAALALASVPILASALVGTIVLFGRRLRPGDWVTLGAITGMVDTLDLLEVRLHTEHGEARVPMLSLLRFPLQKLGARPRVWVRIAVAVNSDLEGIERTLRLGAEQVASAVLIELEDAGQDGLCYRVSGDVANATDRGPLLAALVAALNRAGIALGRSPNHAP